MEKQDIEDGVRRLAASGGAWFYDVPLPHGVWTAGNQGLPHTRLKRVVQAIADTVGKPLAQCRVLDLGCLEGQFAVEMALQGAEAVGVEIREANIEKARFIKRALELENVTFFQDDVRNVSVAKYGRFDAIICSGILYHLPPVDAIALVQTMHDMATACVVIDTHISLRGDEAHRQSGNVYAGHTYVEHEEGASPAERVTRRWASADNTTSFWFTRPSLVNIITEAGFTSVYEAFAPAHLNFGKPGLEHRDRCTFVALKGRRVALRTSPAADGLRERWPEGTLDYAKPASLRRQILNRLLRRR